MADLSWKTADFFKDIIVQDLSLDSGDTFTIARFQIGKATEKNAGYMSLIHRVTIVVEFDGSVEPTTLSYIVKEKSDQVFGVNLVELMSVFPKERETYGKLLPAFERMFAEHGDHVRFGPKMFKATSAPYEVIVMEDLQREHFHMREKPYCLPMADVKGILAKLAKFHAASVVYHERNGGYSDLFVDGVITEKTIEPLRGHYDALYSSLVQSLRERHFPEQYLRPLISLDGKLLEECCKAQRANASDFKVLNHSDLWPNNVMFAENDLLFLDFQTAFYGTFAADILYFFITSATDLIHDSFEELFQFYYQNLVEALHRLKYVQPIPTYVDLLRQMKQRGVLLLPPLSEAVSITMAGLTETSEVELITSEHPEGVALRKRVFSNPEFVALVDRLIPKLYELELLNDAGY